jgi:DNA-binding transcriptional LysR family regulator
MRYCRVSVLPACRISLPGRRWKKGGLMQVLPEWDFIASYHGGVWLLQTPTRYLPPKLRVFIDFLVERLAQEPTLGMWRKNPQT